MKYLYSLALLFTLSFTASYAQMSDGNFGDEWINFDQSYFKMAIAEDGVYRISQSVLVQAGIPVSQIATEDYQLYRLGEQVPIYVSTSGLLEANDYIEFYGQKNRSELDRNLFVDPNEDILNPEYSLVTDTMSYFLTWEGGSTNPRVVEIDNDLNALPQPEAFFWKDELIIFSRFSATRTGHVKKLESTLGEALSTYGKFEGFTGGYRTKTTVTVPTNHRYLDELTTTVKTRFVLNDRAHQHAVSVRGDTIFSQSSSGYSLEDVEAAVPTSILRDNTRIIYEGINGTNDRHAIAYTQLIYPRLFNFDGTDYYEFKIRENNGVTYLEIENFNLTDGIPVLYDVTNQIKLDAVVTGDLVKIALPPSVTERQLVLFNSNTGLNNINMLEPVVWQDYESTATDYLIISNDRLYNDGQGNDFVQQYAAYRASEEGGGFTTTVINVRDLYNQYSYGINRHPLSVRNFIQQKQSQWPNLKYIFIIGKGREYSSARDSIDMSAAYSDFFVPTFGYPGSDNLLVAEKDKEYPIVPIGRIAVTTPRQIEIYLNKMIELESNQQNSPQTIVGRDWMKQILHLGGGGNNSERTSIQQSLIGLEGIIENNKYGANVNSVFKANSDVIANVESDAIFDRINEGVSMLTFFGHSGVGTFDFNIDNPLNYDNKGKYPVMFSLGCYSGNIHTAQFGISEKFVFGNPDQGAIAMGATTGLGFISGLNSFQRYLYTALGTNNFGQGIGDAALTAIRQFDPVESSPFKTLKHQFTLQGDPAFKLSVSPGPDYVIDINSVAFEPATINAQIDSFNMIFDIINLGFKIEDSIDITITQILPNGTTVPLLSSREVSPAHNRQVSVRLPSFKEDAVGLNRFLITLDPRNMIEEFPTPSAENNNSLVDDNGIEGVQLYIIDNSARVVYPPQYGILTAPEAFKLRASTTNGIVAPKDYLMEIDTTNRFNSPIKESTRISASGGLIEWSPALSLVADKVYYWRVSPDSISALESYKWSNSSFVYLPGSSPGWNQSHHFQYNESLVENLTINEGNEFNFNLNGPNIRLFNKTWEPQDPRPAFYFNFDSPASSVLPWSTANGGAISIWYGDAITGGGHLNSGGNYGSIDAAGKRTFTFKPQTPEGRADLMRFMRDTIPTGSMVLFFTAMKDSTDDIKPEEWSNDTNTFGTNIYEILNNQGANLANELITRGTVPYTFFYVKDQSVLAEGIAEDANGSVDVNAFLPVSTSIGFLTTPAIGPAKNWEKLEWNLLNEDVLDDSSHISITGISATGTETLIYSNIQARDTVIAGLDAAQFPYLRIIYQTEDPDSRTAPDLEYLRVRYEGLPDAAINSNVAYQFYNDTIQQGEPMLFEMGIENMTEYDMDSLLVEVSVIQKRNNETTIYQKRIAPLAKGSAQVANFTIDSKDLSGLQQFIFEINPAEDQKELYKFNNFAVRDFFVSGDTENPLLDVTFDGKHIMNGDLVSAQPVINISLTDENEFLLLNDTSNYQLFLKYPGESIARNISFDNDFVRFIPSSTNEATNTSRIEMNPTFSVDGQYELSISSSDVSGNSSGKIDYRIIFEIITKTAISNLVNYPNPFSTSTQFAYTLTGSKSPDFFKIQIFTVSGKVVKEITQDEIGPLRVGTHLTDYRWDGTDEYGGRLANGVYLYRLVAEEETGASVEKLENNAINKFFKQDFGKLVILR